MSSAASIAEGLAHVVLRLCMIERAGPLSADIELDREFDDGLSDLMADFGKTRARDQADVTGANDAKFHEAGDQVKPG